MDPSADLIHVMTWMGMHMTFCSSKEPTPILFLDTAVQFKANEQLERSLRCPCHEALLGNIFFLFDSPHNYIFFFLLLFSFPSLSKLA